ncbi:MAG: hypothetical protein HC876_01300 [Chloroflexaceae bacterium]|nr:hypothetical protein [Chloroflexaceae bacterium]
MLETDMVETLFEQMLPGRTHWITISGFDAEDMPDITRLLAYFHLNTSLPRVSVASNHPKKSKWMSKMSFLPTMCWPLIRLMGA